MATQLSRRAREKSTLARPWRARVKVDYVEYFLGYYATKEEAEQVEDAFRDKL